MTLQKVIASLIMIAELVVVGCAFMATAVLAEDACFVRKKRKYLTQRTATIVSTCG